MTVPDYQSLMLPVLRVLSSGGTHTSRELRQKVAEDEALSEEDLEELLPSGRQTTFTNRVAWALSYLAQAGVVERPTRGSYRLTARGEQLLSGNPNRVDVRTLSQFPEFNDFRARRHDSVAGQNGAQSEHMEDLSPSEAIARLVDLSDREVASELLARVLEMPPSFLERLALRLLQAMGYGGRESLVQHTGRSGDAGLDGIVRQDALGLELVGIQAKRYDKDASVGRPEIQAFVGALQGAQTTRGVFVTTGRFSAGAREFADGVPMRLRLIDGEELSRLMVRYNVGVAVRETFELKQFDEDFFDE